MRAQSTLCLASLFWLGVSFPTTPSQPGCIRSMDTNFGNSYNKDKAFLFGMSRSRAGQAEHGAGSWGPILSMSLIPRGVWQQVGQALLPPDPSVELGSAHREEQESTQREAITSLLLRLFTTCPAKPERISVPSHPPPLHREQPPPQVLQGHEWDKKEKVFISTLLRGMGAATPQPRQATRPVLPRGTRDRKAKGSGAVIYPNPAAACGIWRSPGSSVGMLCVPPAPRRQPASHSTGEEREQ